MTPLSCFCFVGSLCLRWAMQPLCEMRISSRKRRWFLSCILQNFQVSLHGVFFLFFYIVSWDIFFLVLRASYIPTGPTLTWHTVKNVSCNTGENMFPACTHERLGACERLAVLILFVPGPGVRSGSKCQNSAVWFTCAVCDKVTLRRTVLHNNEMNLKAEIWMEVILPVVAAASKQRHIF